MRTLCLIVVSSASLFAATAISAADLGPYEVTVQGDLRAVWADTPYTSSTYGGSGQLRFDEDHDGVRLGRFMIDVAGPLSETVRGLVTLSATDDGDTHAIDATEAYVEWRPYPRGPLRFRTRIGAFYPPISLEQRGVGWQSIYTLTPSAINSWVGEEIRTIGAETTATWAGAPAGRDYDLSVVAGIYGWNDPMGVLIYQRGWALSDRQTALFGSLPRPFAQSAHDARIEFFRELDDRPGGYVGGEWRSGGQVVRALYYNNDGDPSASGGKDSAWLSRFKSIGWRGEFASQTTFIVQGIKGDTAVGASSDGHGLLILDYWSYFALVSQAFGEHRISARFDRMFTDSARGRNLFPSGQSARAWTLAYLWDIDSRWEVGAELVQMSGRLDQRVEAGLPVSATERNVQLAVRWSL
jgi:hypothetical protein